MGPRIFGIIALHAPVVAVVATADGKRQIRDGADGSVQWEADEDAFEPDPTPAAGGRVDLVIPDHDLEEEADAVRDRRT